MACLMSVPTIESYSQCPEDEDCDWPGDDDGGLNYANCTTIGCGPQFVQAQGWCAGGGTWMRLCQRCDKICQTENGTTTVLQGLLVCEEIGNCGVWAMIDPSEDIEQSPFDHLMNVMNDLTSRAAINRRLV
jgi:hypothetical protein